MLTLIDSDIVAFRAAASAENEVEDVALYRVDELMRTILHETDAKTYEAYLTGDNNFRKQLYPEYKANRLGKPRPRWLEDCREYLILEWKAKLVDDYEADDILGIRQSEEVEGCCIASIDKDLLMIPGNHYNFVKKEWEHTDEETSWRRFYTQMLSGDTSDNVMGFDGKMRGSKPPQFIQRMIDSCSTEQECFDMVLEKYDYDYDRFLTNGILLWIWQEEGVLWKTGQERLKDKASTMLLDKITQLEAELQPASLFEMKNTVSLSELTGQG